jgi:hypothetical protein
MFNWSLPKDFATQKENRKLNYAQDKRHKIFISPKERRTCDKRQEEEKRKLNRKRIAA